MVEGVLVRHTFFVEVVVVDPVVQEAAQHLLPKTHLWSSHIFGGGRVRGSLPAVAPWGAYGNRAGTCPPALADLTESEGWWNLRDSSPSPSGGWWTQTRWDTPNLEGEEPSSSNRDSATHTDRWCSNVTPWSRQYLPHTSAVVSEYCEAVSECESG